LLAAVAIPPTHCHCSFLTVANYTLDPLDDGVYCFVPKYVSDNKVQNASFWVGITVLETNMVASFGYGPPGACSGYSSGCGDCHWFATYPNEGPSHNAWIFANGTYFVPPGQTPMIAFVCQNL